MNRKHRFRSRVLAMLEPNIDTDQIIPARYLKGTEKHGLGGFLFADRRKKRYGSPGCAHPLDADRADAHHVLLAGNNFGCGSSREHAAWALLDWGFRAVISTGFADIFRGNAWKNGLLPIEVPEQVHDLLVQRHSSEAALEVHVDLHAAVLAIEGHPPVPFPVDAFARRCLLHEQDALGYLLAHTTRIAAHERRSTS